MGSWIEALHAWYPNLGRWKQDWFTNIKVWKKLQFSWVYLNRSHMYNNSVRRWKALAEKVLCSCFWARLFNFHSWLNCGALVLVWNEWVVFRMALFGVWPQANWYWSKTCPAAVLRAVRKLGKLKIYYILATIIIIELVLNKGWRF